MGNYYGSSEAVGLTYECAAQRLHVNTDWYILEPVDEHDRPVPRGQLSDGVLVTNLANRIQPIIRYQMGDRVAIDPDPCGCGSPFPPIRVVGRTDDILSPHPRANRSASCRWPSRQWPRTPAVWPAASSFSAHHQASPFTCASKTPATSRRVGRAAKTVGGVSVSPRRSHCHDRAGAPTTTAASAQRKVPAGLLGGDTAARRFVDEDLCRMRRR